MEYNTSELCDIYADMIDVVEPMFMNFGGKSSFGGKITTIKCFESLGLIAETVQQHQSYQRKCRIVQKYCIP